MEKKLFYGSLYHGDQQRLIGLSRSEILVYTVMISHGGRDRVLKLAQKRIATLAGVSLGSCKRALTKFKKLKWLEVSDFYQIKQYKILLNFQEVDHSYDLPKDSRVDHSYGPSLDHSYGPSLDHSDDPHVLTNKKEENQFTCKQENKIFDFDSLLSEAKTKDEIIFVRLYHRWSNCKIAKWTTKENQNPLLIWRNIKEDSDPHLQLSLELQIIDSWLLMKRVDQMIKVWRFANWIRGLSSWLKRQADQGARSNISKLSRRQKDFFDYAITEHSIPEPPSLEAPTCKASEASEVKASEVIEDNVVYPPFNESLLSKDANLYLEFILDGGRLNTDHNWSEISDRFWIRPISDLPDDIQQEVVQKIPELKHLQIVHKWRKP